jgi:hypothetical protein
MKRITKDNLSHLLVFTTSPNRSYASALGRRRRTLLRDPLLSRTSHESARESRSAEDSRSAKVSARNTIAAGGGAPARQRARELCYSLPLLRSAQEVPLAVAAPFTAPSSSSLSSAGSCGFDVAPCRRRQARYLAIIFSEAQAQQAPAHQRRVILRLMIGGGRVALAGVRPSAHAHIHTLGPTWLAFIRFDKFKRQGRQ